MICLQVVVNKFKVKKYLDLPINKTINAGAKQLLQRRQAAFI